MAAANSNTAPEWTMDNPCTDMRTLQNAIVDIDALANEGFSAISAIAKLALTQLETPDGYRCIEPIAAALSVIKGRAEEIKDCISVAAEDVGCNHVDMARKKRIDEASAAREVKYGH